MRQLWTICVTFAECAHVLIDTLMRLIKGTYKALTHATLASHAGTSEVIHIPSK